jgi:hypothetical protein
MEPVDNWCIVCWLVKPKQAEKTYLNVNTLFTTDQHGFRWDSTRATVPTRFVTFASHPDAEKLVERTQWQTSCLLSASFPHIIMLCVYLCIPLINLLMSELVFMKPSMYITASEPIPNVYFINPCHKSVCMRTTLSSLDNGSAAMFPWERIRATTELLETSISVRSV